MRNEILESMLNEYGVETVRYENDFISFDFEVPIGRFKGKKIEVALDAPQFPMIPPSGPYIKPFLLPIKTSGRTHPFDGIHDRKLPTSEFQYWSRPCNNWNNCKRKDIKTYLAFLRTLFDF